ncbi:MAG: hypothetical protein HXO80_03890 [Selenomonas sp.]|nr:hypothetical protein [Selenomonas sp.]
MKNVVLEPNQNTWDPQPCVAYMLREFGSDNKLNMVGRCLMQIKEEHKECVDAFADCYKEACIKDHLAAKKHLAEELTDVITAATTGLAMLGYDFAARCKMQERVNEKNKARGYF